jgi:anti-sigma-K factor RskA
MTPDTADSLRDLAPGYVLGALSPEEARTFEAALAGSPDLRREVAEYREVSALLSLRPGTAPAPELRERLLARVAAAKDARLHRARSVSGVPGIAWLAIAASTVLAAGLGWQVIRLTGTVRGLETLIGDRDSVIAVREHKLAEREETLNTILTADRNLTVVHLGATGAEPVGIQFFWNRKHNRAIIHAFGLKPAQPGRVYQLWLMKDGKPIPSTTFNSEADGHALTLAFDVPAEGGYTAAAITEEPEGGSLQPTLPILLFGTVSSD